MNSATEEIKNPHRNIPRSIVFSISGVTLIYILVNAAYFAVLSKEEILGSDAIAVLFGDKAFSLFKWLMPLMVALSIVGGLNASIFTASRVYFAAAREGQLFNALAMINSKELTPIPSLIFLGLTSALYLVTTNITELIEYMTFVETSFAALGVSTMLALRYQLPDLQRPLKVPLLVPITYLLITGTLILLPLWTSPWRAAVGVLVTLTGLPVYYLTAKWEAKPRIYQRVIDKFNSTIQKLTMSVMPSREPELH